MMYSFRNDYSEGAHPRVLQALTDTNLEQTDGYGTDPRCLAAADLVRQLCQAPEADVHFLVGGTQTNLVVIESVLKPFEAVIAPGTSTSTRPGPSRPPATRSAPSPPRTGS